MNKQLGPDQACHNFHVLPPRNFLRSVTFHIFMRRTLFFHFLLFFVHLSFAASWRKAFLGLSCVGVSLGLQLSCCYIDVAQAIEGRRNGVTYTKSSKGISFYDYPPSSPSSSSDSMSSQITPNSKAAIDCKGYLAGRNGWKFIDTTAYEDGEIRLVFENGQASTKTPMIKGLEIGLQGDMENMKPMSKGQKRRLIIPSGLGYTDRKILQQPIPIDEDYRRRLFSTVFNDERQTRESTALNGNSIVGEIVLDVELKRVKN